MSNIPLSVHIAIFFTSIAIATVGYAAIYLLMIAPRLITPTASKWGIVGRLIVWGSYLSFQIPFAIIIWLFLSTELQAHGYGRYVSFAVASVVTCLGCVITFWAQSQGKQKDQRASEIVDSG